MISLLAIRAYVAKLRAADDRAEPGAAMRVLLPALAFALLLSGCASQGGRAYEFIAASAPIPGGTLFIGLNPWGVSKDPAGRDMLGPPYQFFASIIFDHGRDLPKDCEVSFQSLNLEDRRGVIVHASKPLDIKPRLMGLPANQDGSNPDPANEKAQALILEVFDTPYQDYVATLVVSFKGCLGEDGTFRFREPLKTDLKRNVFLPVT